MNLPQGSTVVIAGADRIGDLLFVTPSLRALRAARPDVRIVVLTTPTPAAVLDGSPHVDRVVAVPRGPGAIGRWAYVRAARIALARERPTLLVTVRDRAMYERVARGLGTAYVADGIFAPGRAGHYAERALACIAALGVPVAAATAGAPAAAGSPAVAAVAAPPRYEIHLTTAERSEAARRADALRPGGRPLVVLQAGTRDTRFLGGARARLRDWPVERFAEVARALAKDPGAAVAIHAASAGERRAARRIVALSGGAATILEALTVRTLAALLEQAALLISADTGPLHLGAAVGAPIVAIYGPTDPGLTGPLAPADRMALLKPSEPGPAALVPADAVLVEARRLIRSGRSE